jgi:peptidoglycan/LPS O-acetylase OafA/YrhL
MAASVAVDTFFTISGLLLVYLFMKSNEKGVKFSLPMFYLHRILR